MHEGLGEDSIFYLLLWFAAHSLENEMKKIKNGINPSSSKKKKKERHMSLSFIRFFPGPVCARVRRYIYFLRKEHPSVSLALPPVGWQRTVEHPAQTTTVWACEKTVVMLKQPGHLTSMKKERGVGTRVYSGEK